jgi:hypothetical protein
LWGSTFANLDLFVLIKILVAKYGMWGKRQQKGEDEPGDKNG